LPNLSCGMDAVELERMRDGRAAEVEVKTEFAAASFVPACPAAVVASAADEAMSSRQREWMRCKRIGRLVCNGGAGGPDFVDPPPRTPRRVFETHLELVKAMRDPMFLMFAVMSAFAIAIFVVSGSPQGRDYPSNTRLFVNDSIALFVSPSAREQVFAACLRLGQAQFATTAGTGGCGGTTRSAIESPLRQRHGNIIGLTVGVMSVFLALAVCVGCCTGSRLYNHSSRWLPREQQRVAIEGRCCCVAQQPLLLVLVWLACWTTCVGLITTLSNQPNEAICPPDAPLRNGTFFGGADDTLVACVIPLPLQRDVDRAIAWLSTLDPSPSTSNGGFLRLQSAR
jgi:hypothetical protein